MKCAERGERVFSAYLDIAKDEDSNLKDLLSDLGHYCDMTGIDYVETLKTAIGLWKAEVADPVDLAEEPDVEIYIDGVEHSAAAREGNEELE